jgi:hypothetical protein
MKNRKYVVAFIKHFMTGALTGISVPVETTFATKNAAQTYVDYINEMYTGDALGEDCITHCKWKVADYAVII